MFKPVESSPDFPEKEKAISKFWKDAQIFQKSIDNRSQNNKYVFYDGPPFITGTPHYGSLLPSIAKDVIPRYQTMKGKRVERVWGWDCHGLPIETKVEKDLGIKNRRDIEKYGIQKFVDHCYAYTRHTSAEWKWYIEKIGRWVDFDNSYKTMDQDYMETVMWVFKQLMSKDLIYEGVRTSLFCTRCGTPISNFEIAMDNSYEDMEDPAVTIKFPITSEGKFKGVKVLAWTTTPWTLPANKALVLDPEETYVRAKVQKLEIELERAWLVPELPDLKKLKNVAITQAYIDDYVDADGNKPRDARIRKKGDSYEFTTKYYAHSKEETGQLIEHTEAINKEKYVELIKTATKKVVKMRYYYPLENGLTGEIDVYQNNLAGLNLVEVEFPTVKKATDFQPPSWFGKEVTDSEGIFPPKIAEMTLAQAQAVNDAYTQKPHNYSEAATTDEVVIAKKRMDYVFKNVDFEVVDEFPGKELLGLTYQPPFSYYPTEANDHKIYSFEGMVTMEEGTGIVHSAPGFGEIDTDMGEANKLSRADSVDDEGKFRPTVKDYAGIYIKAADPKITADLKRKGILFRSERIVHRYPFCYRCHTPLIQKAQPSWYIKVQQLKPDLLKNNENINWVPSHLKEGRFKKGIAAAPDWGISRTRFWATPLPVWQLVKDDKIVERVVIGSRDELRAQATQPITKLVLVRHARRDKSSDDGELTEEGWKQVEELNRKLQPEKLDGVYSATTRRARQTVDDIAVALKQEVNEDDVFGSIADRQKYNEIEAQLKQKFNVEMASEVPEADLLLAYKDYIADIKKQLEAFLAAHKGEYILAGTHAERIAFIRHIVEGRNLSEALALDIPHAGTVSIYFNGTELLDLHRPKIDCITLKGKQGELTRVTDVLDVWMDSGSMPYASRHYPFENKLDFESNFPADFVIEYIAQTRAWFYVMHVIATSLMQTNSFKNVVTTGVIFGTDGRKMSKSYGNYPDPRDVLLKYGAEPLRLYLMGSRVMLGEDINFDEDALKDQLKTFLLPLWNSYSFLVTYADMHNWTPDESLASNVRTANASNNEIMWDHIPFKELKSKLDQWIIARLQLAIRDVTTQFDDYNTPGAVREYYAFLDDLSKWYIRRSRERFAKGDSEALATLYYVLVEFSKLIAPIAPFISEEVFQNLVVHHISTQGESVHLTDYPHADIKYLEASEKILWQMEQVRSIVSIGQSLRAKAGIKVRQPLQELEVMSNFDPDRDYEFEQWMKDVIADELNVKLVDEEHELLAKDGWVMFKDEASGVEVNLDLNLSAELKREGILRDLIRSVQDLRKKQGLKLGDEVKLSLASTDAEIKLVVSLMEAELKQAVGAKELTFEASEHPDWTAASIQKLPVFIRVN